MHVKLFAQRGKVRKALARFGFASHTGLVKTGIHGHGFQLKMLGIKAAQ